MQCTDLESLSSGIVLCQKLTSWSQSDTICVFSLVHPNRHPDVTDQMQSLLNNNCQSLFHKHYNVTSDVNSQESSAQLGPWFLSSSSSSSVCFLCL